MDVSAALTRDNAAQMIWNALQAVEVEYTYTLVTENGQLVSKVVVQDKAPATVGSNKYDYTLLYDKYKAVMTNDADTYDTLTMTKYKWNDKNGEYDYTFTDNKSKEHTFSSAADYTSLFAQQVNVVYKNTTDEPVYGIYAEDSQVLYEGIAGDIEDNDQDSIKIDGVKYKVDDDKGLAGVEYYAENVYTPAGDSDDAQDYYTCLLYTSIAGKQHRHHVGLPVGDGQLIEDHGQRHAKKPCQSKGPHVPPGQANPLPPQGPPRHREQTDPPHQEPLQRDLHGVCLLYTSRCV